MQHSKGPQEWILPCPHLQMDASFRLSSRWSLNFIISMISQGSRRNFLKNHKGATVVMNVEKRPSRHRKTSNNESESGAKKLNHKRHVDVHIAKSSCGPGQTLCSRHPYFGERRRFLFHGRISRGGTRERDVKASAAERRGYFCTGF